jgi:Sulfotransferase family
MLERPPGMRPKVLYVMGAGHSGSTILGVALGNCAGFVYTGELEEWLLAAERPRWAAGDRQSFWSAVKDRVHGAEGLFGSVANRCIERSSVVFRIDLWPTRRRILRVYRQVAEEVIAAVADVAGARYVVDTSHFPLRARELQKLNGIELYLVYLVRDPRAVVASNMRDLSPHEVAETRWRAVAMNADLWLTQLVSTCVFLRHPRERRIFVRHEDFLADPEWILRQILDRVGSRAQIPDLEELRIGAPLQGNRLIRSETVGVRRSGPAPAPRRPLTWLVQAPWRPVLRRLRPAATLAGARGVERRTDPPAPTTFDDAREQRSRSVRGPAR